VLIVTQHSPDEHRQVHRNVLELASRGFHLDVVCSAGLEGGDLEDLRHAMGIHRIPIRHRRTPAIRYPFEYIAFFLAALGVVSALGLRRRYDVVQVDNLPDHLVFVTLVPRLRGSRVVFNMFELMPDMVSSRYPRGLHRGLFHVARWIERAATAWSHQVIVVSQDCLRRVHARGVPASKLSVVVNTTPWPARQLDVNGRARPPGDRRFVVTHGTVVRRYGVHLSMEAFARVAPRWPDLEFRVIGDGPERPHLQRLATELGLSDRVRQFGYLPWAETIEQISGAAVGIVSVLADGYGEILLPTKLLEYAAIGVPVVCARLPAVEDYFPEDSLSYFTPGDAEQLAARLEELLRDPALAARQAQRAAEIVQQLDWDHMRDTYIAALGLPVHASPAQALAAAGHASPD
jgi:glycosyltransferase involved in cell wall biosynthesis